jgi:hypothetical protein
MVRAEDMLKMGLVYVLASVGGFGCGSKNVAKELPRASLQLKNIGYAYVRATESNGSAPNSKDELMPFLNVPKGPDNPEKTINPADTFRSPTDGEEFVIHWGVDIRTLNLAGNPDRLPVIVYEKYGKDGKRYVLQGVRQVRHVTDEDFANLPFPPGFKRP